MDSLVERLRAEQARNGGQGAYAWTARELCGKAAARIAEQDRLLQLARDLIAAVDQMVADTAPIFAEMEIARGCRYQGRQIGPELEALRQALAAMEQADADR